MSRWNRNLNHPREYCVDQPTRAFDHDDRL